MQQFYLTKAFLTTSTNFVTSDGKSDTNFAMMTDSLTVTISLHLTSLSFGSGLDKNSFSKRNEKTSFLKLLVIGESK